MFIWFLHLLDVFTVYNMMMDVHVIWTRVLEIFLVMYVICNYVCHLRNVFAINGTIVTFIVYIYEIMSLIYLRLQHLCTMSCLPMDKGVYRGNSVSFFVKL